MKVLLVAPNIDGTDVGEAFVAFKWAEALGRRVDLTVLTFQRAGRKAVADQLPGVEVVTFPEPAWLGRFERFNAMAKPAWPLFCRNVRRFVREASARGERFDLAHQLMPNAARYASPLNRCGIPYVVGPVGGGLSTPDAFRAECGTARWYTRARALDSLRLARDPWLRRSFMEAELVLGVAPYVRDHLRRVPPRRFEAMLEIGVDAIAPPRARERRPGMLRLLHVGRAVRTKGLRDAVRAMAHLADRPGITLTAAGAGEEVGPCREEAERLGLGERVTILGGVPRAEVERLYAAADVFLFPSFREPAGGVLLEAMRWGLPVVTVDRGGPGFIVDAACGLAVPVTDPVRMPRDLAAAVATLADDPALLERLGEGALARVESVGLWSERAARMVELYGEIARGRALHVPARTTGHRPNG